MYCSLVYRDAACRLLKNGCPFPSNFKGSAPSSPQRAERRGTAGRRGKAEKRGKAEERGKMEGKAGKRGDNEKIEGKGCGRMEEVVLLRASSEQLAVFDSQKCGVDRSVQLFVRCWPLDIDDGRAEKLGGPAPATLELHNNCPARYTALRLHAPSCLLGGRTRLKRKALRFAAFRTRRIMLISAKRLRNFLAEICVGEKRSCKQHYTVAENLSPLILLLRILQILKHYDVKEWTLFQVEKNMRSTSSWPADFTTSTHAQKMVVIQF